MKTVIVITKDESVDVYGTLTAVCRDYKQFSYHCLKSKKFPFTYKGMRFYKNKIK